MSRFINLRWRQVRWALAAAVMPVLWACNTQPLHAPEAVPGASIKQYFLQKLNNQVDILFLVDNSPSMESVQTHLASQFPSFVNVLKNLPNGLPDVHIGIISSDLGTGAVTSGVPGCVKQPFGDGGALQHNAGKQYTWNPTTNKFDTSTKTCTPPTGNFIAATGGVGTEGTTNYTGTMTDVFSCIASIGATGCGFEHVLGSVQRALGVDPWGYPAPTENDEFLRQDAYLAIILITNEDDCSVPPDSVLFDPNSRNLSGQYGPLASYRCNVFGHKCDGQSPPMRPTDPQFGGQSTWAPTTCESNEDGTLLKVADVVAQVKTAKASADMIFVGALSGPASPYEVYLDTTLPAASGAAGESWPKIRPSCTVEGGAVSEGPAGTADPAVRVKQFVDTMGGTFESICASDFGLALKNIASALGQKLGAQCLGGKLKDVKTDENDPNSAGLQFDCQVTDRQKNQSNVWVETVLTQCDQADPTTTAPSFEPCWYVATDAKCPAATASQVIRVYRSDPNALTAGANIAVSCVTCLPGETGTGCDY